MKRRERPTVAMIRTLEARVEQLERALEHERDQKKNFGKKIFFTHDSKYSHDYDESGNKLPPLPDPKIGDVVVIEHWECWLGGLDPTGERFAVRVTEPHPDGFSGIALGNYVPARVGNDEFILDRHSTRTLAR